APRVGYPYGCVVTCVCMPDHAQTRVVRKSGSNPLVRLAGPVSEDGQSRVDGVTYPDPSAVVDRDPRCPRDRVEESVKDRPVSNRIGAVLHPLSLPVWRGNRARIEMISADHYRRGDPLVSDHSVDNP